MKEKHVFVGDNLYDGRSGSYDDDKRPVNIKMFISGMDSEEAHGLMRMVFPEDTTLLTLLCVENVDWHAVESHEGLVQLLEGEVAVEVNHADEDLARKAVDVLGGGDLHFRYRTPSESD